MKKKKIEKKEKKQKSVGYIKNNIAYTVLSLPLVIKTIFFSVVPFIFIVIGFQDYNGVKGIFGSDWVGFDNFVYFFRNGSIWKVIWNTVYLNMLMILIGTPLTIIMALMMFEVKRRGACRLFQTIYFIPYLISWTVAKYSFESILAVDGLINQLFGTSIDFYQASNANWWPLILILCNMWKGQGYSILIYYASLNSMDTTVFEAADLDGANRFHKMWYISLPHLKKMIAIMFIMSMAGVFRSDFGLFWFIPRNDTDRTLLETTEVLDTYLYQLSFRRAEYSSGTAIGLVQSIVGTIMLLITNKIAKLIDKDVAFI